MADVNFPLTSSKSGQDQANSNSSDDDTVFDSGKDNLGEETRHSWGRKAEYLLSAIGYSVGLGNVYRFPYVCIRNGGGAFLIPFFICLIICGLPLYFLEVSMGQFIAKSSFHSFAICPLLKGAGLAANMLSLVCSWYYAIILGWTLIYLVHSFRDPLPWSLCGQWWNTDNCVVSIGQTSLSSNMNDTTIVDQGLTALSHVNNSLTGMYNLTQVNYTMITSNKTTSASEEFWLHNVLQISDGFDSLTSLPWHTSLALGVATIMVLLGIIKVVKSVGKVVYLTATLPYILIGILLIKGATLTGAGDGVLFYLTPDFSKLLTLRTWLEASLQVFFSLGPGWGGLHTMASYNKFKNNCFRDAVFLTFMCEGSSVFAGFAIFTILGHMSHTLDIPVANFSRSGAGLAFVVYPEAISYLPVPQLWAVLFFLMMVTIGLDTLFVNAETFLTTVADVWPNFMRRRGLIVKTMFFAVLFLVSLPFASRGGMYLFQLVDWYCAIITVPLITFMECIMVSYIYGFRRFSRDISLMIGYEPSCVFKYLWGIITPFILLSIFISSLLTYTPPTLGDYEYGSNAQAAGWLIGLFSFIPIPVWAAYKLVTTRGTLWQRVKYNLAPNKFWRPADPELREKYSRDIDHVTLSSIDHSCCSR